MDKTEEKALEYFKIWRDNLENTIGYSLGDSWEDQQVWYECFLAGFKYGILHKANNS